MNQDRRKRLEKIQGLIDDAIAQLEEIREEEQEAFDNMPESIQDGERGETMQEHISNMEDVESSLDDARSVLEDVVNV